MNFVSGLNIKPLQLSLRHRNKKTVVTSFWIRVAVINSDRLKVWSLIKYCFDFFTRTVKQIIAHILNAVNAFHVATGKQQVKRRVSFATCLPPFSLPPVVLLSDKGHQCQKISLKKLSLHIHHAHLSKWYCEWNNEELTPKS